MAPRILHEPYLPCVEVHDFDSRDNSLNELEVKLQQELVALGRLDIAAAVGAGRKYQRLQYVTDGALASYEYLAGMRLAFEPHATVPESKEAWIEEAKIQFAADTRFAEVIAAYEEKLEEERTQAENTRESSPTLDSKPTESPGPTQSPEDSNERTASQGCSEGSGSSCQNPPTLAA